MPDDELLRNKMPSLDELRNHVRSMLAEASNVELAKAILEGDRIDSYQPYLDWLQADDTPELCTAQFAELLLYSQRHNTAFLFENISRALNLLRQVTS